MFNSQARTERRKRDREQQRWAANKRVGHDLAYWILYGGQMLAAVGLALLAFAAVWVWVSVDRILIAETLGAVGILILAVYAAWWARRATPQSRVLARAAGMANNALVWHLVGAAGLLLVVAGVLLWQQVAA